MSHANVPFITREHDSGSRSSARAPSNPTCDPVDLYMKPKSPSMNSHPYGNPLPGKDPGSLAKASFTSLHVGVESSESSLLSAAVYVLYSS